MKIREWSDSKNRKKNSINSRSKITTTSVAVKLALMEIEDKW